MSLSYNSLPLVSNELYCGRDITFESCLPHTVAALIGPEDVPSLQMLVTGGESLTPDVRNTWADAVTLLNG